MNKNYFVIIIVAAVSILYFSYSTPQDKVQLDLKDKPTVLEIKKTVKLMDQIREFPGLAKSNLSEEERKSQCKEAIESIETMPLKTLIYDLSQSRLKLDSNCLFKSKNNIRLLKDFPEVCLSSENKEPSHDCVEKLFLYKNLRIHHATINDNIDSLSTEIIINKLFGLIAEEAFSTAEGLKLFREVGSKLYERLPDSDSAAKAAVLGYFADDHLSSEDKEKFDKILDEVRHKFSDNWDLYELDLVRKKMHNDDSFKNEVASFFARNPNSAIGAYQMGCVKWSEKNGAEAIRLFQAAVAIDPQNTRFSETLQKAQMPNPPEKVCTVQINFDPDKF